VSDHRRTPGRKAYVLPGWFLTLTAAACVAGLLGLGWVVMLAPDDEEDPAGPTAATSTPTPTPTPTTTPTPTPTPTASPTPSPKPKPKVTRKDVDVTVLNATRTTGLARQVAARVRAAGWTVASVGNWRTGAAQTAVHFPRGRKAEARLLAKDLGVDSVLPSTSGMRSDRLTVILLGLP
jgi:LytR cell envelope-related transcriptional attenuator